jgi:leucyl-tRNA synthetase
VIIALGYLTSRKGDAIYRDRLSTPDLVSIGEKWRLKWREVGLFNSDPDLGRKKYFITVAYPYPNSPQHVGHGRTYTLTDVHARYMRMKGYNVLFPMGFHYTGTPILAMSKRVASGDEELIETFAKVHHVSIKDIAGFVEPLGIARFFHNEIKQGMVEMGYSIDWRREFTTIDKAYSKFVSWQFRLLRKKGLIIKGSYPVAWCLNDQNAVSQHDTIGDVEPDFNEYLLIKFELEGHSWKILTSTLRPETIYGVTNLWIRPESRYVEIQVKNPQYANGKEEWLVSESAVQKLKYLNYDIFIKSTLIGKDLVGKRVIDPVRHCSIPIYPASFVDPNSGTGIVMSVPAHAPYDYQALEDLRQDNMRQRDFGISDINSLKPITIIETGDHSEVKDKFENQSAVAPVSDAALSPASEIIKKFRIRDQNDPRLEDATNELYSQEYYKGRMMQNTGKLKGTSVSEAKDVVRRELIASSSAELMFELVDSSVRCRCGSGCVVKILKDQWFLDYRNEQWKKLAHQCMNEMDIIPEEIRQEFNYVIDWLKERACARKSGLGTKIPWDQNWLIESLSDSVIYMAYYIIAKYINNDSISDVHDNYDNLNDSFFDYVFLGRGNSDQVAQACNLDSRVLEQIRNEFQYFYPLDSRHSGRDLVPNHLSFFIFNHVAIFEKVYWPRQIVVNGSVLMEGKKMSKSLGNIIPLRDAIKEYGADSIRLAMLSSSELLQDADFSFDAVKGIRSRLFEIYNIAVKQLDYDNLHQRATELKKIEVEDRWLVSRLQRVISSTTVLMDKLRVRESLHNILYLLDQDLAWYRRRTRSKERENSIDAGCIMAEFIGTRVRMLAPFAPFLCEEIWEKIHKFFDSPVSSSNSILYSGWPVANPEVEDMTAEESEEMVQNVLFDIQNIIKVTKLVPTKIHIYVSAKWKRKMYQKILEIILAEKKAKFGEIMKVLSKDPELSTTLKKNVSLIQKITGDIISISMEVRQRRLKLGESFKELDAIKDAEKLISLESSARAVEVLVYQEQDQNNRTEEKTGTENISFQLSQEMTRSHSKAGHSRPFKPAIYIE